MKSKRLYICHIVPNQKTKHFHASQAGNNFCMSLVDGKCFDKTISIVPPSYDLESQNEPIISYISSYSPYRLLAIFRLFYNQLKVAILSNKYSSIWFYNIWYLDFITYIICRFILRKKVYVIFADNTPTTRRLSFETFFFWLIKKSHGVISLSARSALTNKNLHVMPGIASKYLDWHSPKEEKLKILFSGSLTEYSGSSLLKEWLDTSPNYEIYISGNNVANIDFSKYPDIHYLGFVTYDKYLGILKDCNICLSLRDPSCPENRNNFPSKIIEYLSYNKVVLSTMIYPELEGWEYETCKYNLCSLQLKLDIIDREYLKYDHLKNQEKIEALNESSWKVLINEIEMV